jgi:hypothetical protein
MASIASPAVPHAVAMNSRVMSAPGTEVTLRQARKNVSA